MPLRYRARDGEEIGVCWSSTFATVTLAGVGVIALGEGGARAAIVHTVGIADIAGALDRVLARNQPPLCAVTRLFPEIAK